MHGAAVPGRRFPLQLALNVVERRRHTAEGSHRGASGRRMPGLGVQTDCRRRAGPCTPDLLSRMPVGSEVEPVVHRTGLTVRDVGAVALVIRGEELVRGPVRSGARRGRGRRLDRCVGHGTRRREWHVALLLLSENGPKPIEIGGIELPIARRCALRHEQPLRLKEPNLRDGHVGKVLFERVEDFSDRQIAPTPARRLGRAGRPGAVDRRHRSPRRGSPASRNSSRNLPISSSSPERSSVDEIRCSFT